MARIHSHYENLRVARDARPEVIRAAYRALARRYHPDVNPSEQAAKVMAMLNRAMKTLGDPQRRAEHDAWIAEAEAAAEIASWPVSPVRAVAVRPRPERPNPSPKAAPRKSRGRSLLPRRGEASSSLGARKVMFGLLIAALTGVALVAVLE